VDVDRKQKSADASGGVIYNLLAKCHLPHNKKRETEAKYSSVNSFLADSDYSDSDDEFENTKPVVNRSISQPTEGSASHNVPLVASTQSTNSMTRSLSSNSSNGADENGPNTSHFSKYQNHPLGNSRQELAKLYKETYCQPYPSESMIEAAADLIGHKHKPRSKRSAKPKLPREIVPKELPPHVLKPGLYHADYGDMNGYEILMLEYKIREITLTKVGVLLVFEY